MCFSDSEADFDLLRNGALFYNIPTSATTKLCICTAFPSPRSLNVCWSKKKIGLSLDGTGTETKAVVIVPNSLSSGILPRHEGELGKGWLCMPTILTPNPIGYIIPRSFFQPGVMLGSVSNRICVVSLSPWSFLPSLSVGRFGGFLT